MIAASSILAATAAVCVYLAVVEPHTKNRQAEALAAAFAVLVAILAARL